MRQVVMFAAFVLSVRWVAPPPGHAQTPGPSRDSLLWAACMPVYVDQFKRQGSDEQKAPVMASMICQMVAGACPPELAESAAIRASGSSARRSRSPACRCRTWRPLPVGPI